MKSTWTAIKGHLSDVNIGGSYHKPIISSSHVIFRINILSCAMITEIHFLVLEKSKIHQNVCANSPKNVDCRNILREKSKIFKMANGKTKEFYISNNLFLLFLLTIKCVGSSSAFIAPHIVTFDEIFRHFSDKRQLFSRLESKTIYFLQAAKLLHDLFDMWKSCL